MNPATRLVGLVTNWKSTWGFADGQDASAYFIYYNSLRGGRKNLTAGMVIEFTPKPGSKGRAPVATDVVVLEE